MFAYVRVLGCRGAIQSDTGRERGTSEGLLRYDVKEIGVFFWGVFWSRVYVVEVNVLTEGFCVRGEGGALTSPLSLMRHLSCLFKPFITGCTLDGPRRWPAYLSPG